jgi:hypothetical protein
MQSFRTTREWQTSFPSIALVASPTRDYVHADAKRIGRNHLSLGSIELPSIRSGVGSGIGD